MRENKYRAWDKCNKKMYSYKDIEWWPIRALNSDADVYEFIQYTGLKDKKGKEIYEGDIIRYYHYKRKIEKTWGAFGFQAERDRFMTLHEICDAGSIHKIEIIGNIHENSELLDS